MEYIIPLKTDLKKYLMEEYCNKVVEYLKMFSDKNSARFEVFETEEDRVALIHDHVRKTVVELRNTIPGAYIMDYDLNPELDCYYIKVYVPDDVEFDAKGCFKARVINTPDMNFKHDTEYHISRVLALDYIKKPH